MGAYILRRLIVFPVFLLVVSIATFLIMRGLPGDAALVNLGFNTSNCDDCRAQVRQSLGLDKPLPEQYWIWISHAVRWDFGNSTNNRRPIAPEIQSRLPNSIELVVLTVIVSAIIGVSLGTISAVTRGSPTDLFARVISVLGLSVPQFWIGTLVVLLPAIWWGWTPAGKWVRLGTDPLANLKIVALPVIVLALGSAAYVARFVRSAMIEALASDYVRTARAKGLPRRAVVFSHAFRNCLLTVLTVIGLQAGTLLGGTLVVESIFGIPGFGRLAVEAITARDYQTMQAVMVLFALWFILVQLLVDIAYAWINPRIRYV
jgi:peptide/nickel transport system permease protein